jgi:Domain of unknown function (DUF4123)
MSNYHVTNPAWQVQAGARHRRMIQLMPPQAAWLYGVIDAAANEDIFAMLQQEPTSSDVLCLYDGDPGIRFARYAPYLFKIHANSHLAEHWLAQGWQHHWGIFFFSAQAPRQVKTHLKKLLSVRIGGKKALLRFYDPRVLPDVLTTTVPTHTHDYFGKEMILSYLVPQGEQGQHIWQGQAVFNGRLQRWMGAATLHHQQHLL